MRFDMDTLSGACGVSILSNFHNTYASYDTKQHLIPTAGCGWVCAGFIYEDEDSDAMFEWMSKQGDLMYKSPVKINRNSGNKFYFAMFDFSRGKEDEATLYGFENHDDFQDA